MLAGHDAQVQSGQTSLDAVLHDAGVDKINQLSSSINYLPI